MLQFIIHRYDASNIYAHYHVLGELIKTNYIQQENYQYTVLLHYIIHSILIIYLVDISLTSRYVFRWLIIIYYTY